MLNRLDASWIVTLINNNGVTKAPAAASINDGGSVEVIIGSRTPIEEIKVWRSAHQPAIVGGQHFVRVNSGDVVVLEIVDGK